MSVMIGDGWTGKDGSVGWVERHFESEGGR